MLLFLTARSFAQRSDAPVPQDANQLVREVINNELQTSQQDHSHWMYREQREEQNKSTVEEVVETNQCDLKMLLATNGQPLTGEQQKSEIERLQKLARDPAEQRKKMRAEKEDAHKAFEMFRMLPDAFVYQYTEKNASLTKLTFKPNPNFHPPSREAWVFHQMDGSMLVDARQKRLVELEGQLGHEVQFLGGMLGHLDKGGRFSVKRAEVAPGHWETTLIHVQMNGKILLFKTIKLQQTDSMTKFLRVPEELSPPQAAEMLSRQDFARPSGVEAAGGSAGRVAKH